MSFQKNRPKPKQENRNTRGAQERQEVREHGLQTQVGKQTETNRCPDSKGVREEKVIYTHGAEREIKNKRNKSGRDSQLKRGRKTKTSN